VFQQYHSKKIYQSFTHKMAAKVSWLWNYVTVTLCISTSDKPKYGPTKVLWLIYLGTGIRAPPKWFLGLTEFTSQTAYRLVQPCCRVHQCVPHTDTQAYGAWNIGNNTNNTSVSHVAWVRCCLLVSHCDWPWPMTSKQDAIHQQNRERVWQSVNIWWCYRK